MVQQTPFEATASEPGCVGGILMKQWSDVVTDTPFSFTGPQWVAVTFSLIVFLTYHVEVNDLAALAP